MVKLVKYMAVVASLLNGVAALAQTWEEKVIASVLMAEAASEGETGMSAVAEVIRQRCIEKSQTPLTVVSKRRAFSSLNGITQAQLVTRQSRQTLYAKALEIAQLLCREPSRLPNATRAANHFTRKTERPSWARKSNPVAVIGNHAFYRLAQW